MTNKAILLSALAGISFWGQGASAAVLLDTYNVGAGQDLGGNAIAMDLVNGGGPFAQSFYAPTNDFISALGFALSASNPTDGGSVLVYLVPDDASGGLPGVAGAPTYTYVGGPTPSFSFDGATLLGSIADSTLGSSPSLMMLSASFAVTPGEYWIALVANNSSANWWYNDGSAGIGDTNQNGFDLFGGPGVNAPETFADSLGSYEMVVDSPEPAALALLGVGMTGLAWARRRKATPSSKG